MKVDSIKQGIVLDHIKAGRSMELYHALGLDELDCCIAIIKNVRSEKMGRKDIIKIDADICIDLNVIGYIDPNITVNVIKDERLERKERVVAPRRLVNLVSCNNPRCITMTEQEIEQVFEICDDGVNYRCVYCEAVYAGKK
ncbi:MAG: aspartate carbamoyltransferase regulatory subunit [Oscillospiraceae bacterium]|jgi:aspartate carbamoyltransferase regulatory subunit|nr:aspartate carbamoyltransferase regulatory subunit [Oscillospiraceae bacterium]